MSVDGAWPGDRATRWLRVSAGLERQMLPVSEVLFAAAGLAAGERVLDIGCGTGPTTRQAAAEVGPDGQVTGVDVAPEMLQAAAAIPAPGAPIEWVHADVGAWTPPTAAYDVVLSRFGVMFFADPPATFAALAAAVRPGGRLAMAVWGRRDASRHFSVPLTAALDVLAARGIPVPDGLSPVQGPFSLWHEETTRNLLQGAGWGDVAVATHVLTMPFGGGLPPRAAAESAADFGPTRLAVAALDDEGRAAATSAMEAAMAPHTGADGLVRLDGTVLVITATRA